MQDLIGMNMINQRKQVQNPLQPPAPAPQPAPQSAAMPLPPDGGMSYTKPPGDLIATGLPGGVASPMPDPYATGVTGMPSAAGTDNAAQAAQMLSQQPAQGPLQATTPQFGPTKTPSWGGPRFMANRPRRQPYQPSQPPNLAA